jgi:hypothetical protein
MITHCALQSAQAVSGVGQMQTKPICQYRKERFNLASICELGLYGGKVTDGTCRRCISRSENTPEFAKSLLKLAEKSHPSHLARISGCCDRADQA